MIDIEGFNFIGTVRLAWPIAGKIAELSKGPIEKNTLVGVTEKHTEYKKLPDPVGDEISHRIIAVNAIEPDVIEVIGQFLSTSNGETKLKMFKDNPKLAETAKLFPNMYGVSSTKEDGTPDIIKESVCTIDILLEA